MSGSHNRTVWSLPAEASRRRPSDVVPNATDRTAPVWPLKVSRLSSLRTAPRRVW